RDRELPRRRRDQAEDAPDGARRLHRGAPGPEAGRRRSKKCVSRKSKTFTEGLSMKPMPRRVSGRVMVVAVWLVRLLVAGLLGDAAAPPRSPPRRPGGV